MSKTKLYIFHQLWEFMRINKKLWLLPIVIILVLFGFILVLAQGSAFAPFIYAIF
jgi:drug/metabolite transporter superfamily protein YnfA